MDQSAIILGTGGTGTKIVYLIQKLIEEGGVDVAARESRVHLMTFDADAPPVGTADVRSPPQSFLVENFSGDDAVEGLRTQDSVFRTWWPKRWGARHDGKKIGFVGTGSGAIPPVGRLVLRQASNLRPDFFPAVQSAVRDFNTRYKALDDPDRKQRPYVFVVGSVCGGVGSGTLADLGFYLRSVIGERQQAQLWGVVLLPSIYSDAVDDNAQRNGYTVVQELNFWMWQNRFLFDREGRGEPFGYELHNGEKTVRFRPNVTPFDQVILVGGRDARGVFQPNPAASLEFAARLIYSLACKPEVSQSFRSFEVDFQKNLSFGSGVELSVSHGVAYPRSFAAGGLATIVFNRRLTTSWLAAQLLARALRRVIRQEDTDVATAKSSAEDPFPLVPQDFTVVVDPPSYRFLAGVESAESLDQAISAELHEMTTRLRLAYEAADKGREALREFEEGLRKLATLPDVTFGTLTQIVQRLLVQKNELLTKYSSVRKQKEDQLSAGETDLNRLKDALRSAYGKALFKSKAVSQAKAHVNMALERRWKLLREQRALQEFETTLKSVLKQLQALARWRHEGPRRVMTEVFQTVEKGLNSHTAVERVESPTPQVLPVLGTSSVLGVWLQQIVKDTGLAGKLKELEIEVSKSTQELASRHADLPEYLPGQKAKVADEVKEKLLAAFRTFVENDVVKSMDLVDAVELELALTGTVDKGAFVRKLLLNLKDRCGYMAEIRVELAGSGSHREKALCFCNAKLLAKLSERFPEVEAERLLKQASDQIVNVRDNCEVSVLKFRGGLGLFAIQEVVESLRQDHENRLEFRKAEDELESLHTDDRFRDANLPQLKPLTEVQEDSQAPIAVFCLAESLGIIESDDSSGTYKYKGESLVPDVRSRAKNVTAFGTCDKYDEVTKAVQEQWDGALSEIDRRGVLVETGKRLEAKANEVKDLDLRGLLRSQAALFSAEGGSWVVRFDFLRMGQRTFENMFLAS